jgi:plastocyanin
MNTNQTVGIVIAAIVIVLGAWYLFTSHGTMAPATATSTDMGTMNQGGTTTTTTSTTTSTTAVPGQPVTITYTKNGFSPSNLKIRAGTVVTWVNNSTEQLEVASDPHPSHTAYDGTSRSQHCVGNAPTSSSVFDECTSVATGGSWSFTFGKVGSWGFHNHLNPSKLGSITVFAADAATTTTTVKVQVQ